MSKRQGKGTPKKSENQRTKKPKTASKQAKIFPRGTSPSVKPLLGPALLELSSEEEEQDDNKFRDQLEDATKEELIEGIMRYLKTDLSKIPLDLDGLLAQKGREDIFLNCLLQK